VLQKCIFISFEAASFNENPISKGVPFDIGCFAEVKYYLVVAFCYKANLVF
jgi:hypothetical protein